MQKKVSFCRTHEQTHNRFDPAQARRRREKEEMLTLTTEKVTSQGWNAAGSRCDVAVSAASLSNSSSQATADTARAGAAAAPSSRAAAATAGSASFRVWFLGGRCARRSEESGDIFGPFQLTSTNAFASASGPGDPSGERGAGGGGRPSARRTTRRTRIFRAGGGRGHRIIRATITAPAVKQAPCSSVLRQKKSQRLPATTPPPTSERKSKLQPNCPRESQLGCKSTTGDSIPAPEPAQRHTNWEERTAQYWILAAGSGLGARIYVGAGRDLRKQLEIGTGIYEEKNARAERNERRGGRVRERGNK